jgi:iron complex outermembrane receptor protein
VVSATRRDETIQNVPITMTALTSESLEQSGVAQTSQLQQVTPGLVIARNSAIFQPTIRGIGSRAATAGNIAVRSGRRSLMAIPLRAGSPATGF